MQLYYTAREQCCSKSQTCRRKTFAEDDKEYVDHKSTRGAQHSCRTV